jgi:hypothetical protein
MKSPFRILALTIAVAAALPGIAKAEAVGKVIFQSGNTFIVGPNGSQRPAAKGDMIQAGERIVTGDNTLAQVKMKDGSFVGVRPGSDLKFQELRLTGANPGQNVALAAGSIRVLNLPASGAAKPIPMTVQAGDARIVMRGADIESAVKRDTGAGVETITRLNQGSSTLSNGIKTLDLEVNGVNSATKARIAEVSIAALPPVDVKPPAPAPGPGTVAARAPSVVPLDVALPQNGPLALPPVQVANVLDARGTTGLAVSPGLKQATVATFVPTSTLAPGGASAVGAGSALIATPALPTTILSNPGYAGGATEIAAAIVGNGSVGIIKGAQITLPPMVAAAPPPPPSAPAMTAVNTSNLAGLTTFTARPLAGANLILLRK